MVAGARAAVPSGVTQQPDRAWVPRLAAGVSIVIGLLDIAAGVMPSVWHRLEGLADFLPGAFTNASRAGVVVAGVGFLLLAGALARRKRRAWQLTLALLVGSALLHVVEGPNWILFAVSLIMATALALLQREFYAVGDPRTRWSSLGAFVALGLVSLLVGSLLVYGLRAHAARSEGLAKTFGWVVLGFFGIPTPLDATDSASSDSLYYGLLGLGLLTAGVTLFLLLRSPRPLPFLSATDEEDMRRLLDREGCRDSLGYFALRRDKSVVWSPSRKSCVAYQVTSGVMLASGDPLGDPEAWPGAIAAFLEEARIHAWVPGVVACSETGAEVWCREAGMEALEIGDEAIVDVDSFTLEGRAMRNVRQMVNRVRRAGYVCEARRLHEVPAEELEEIRAKADTWRVGDTERGFSMALGRIGDPGDEECVLVTARLDDEVRGLLSFVPWGRDGLSLDLMRRDQTADPGLNELLIVEALEQAARLGVRRMSLNFAVFRSALERGERIGAGPLTRAWRRVLLFASRFAQIESLYRFNAKFRPVWEPRFILYSAVLGLPRLTVAYLEAEAFIARPRLTFWRARDRRAAAATRPA